MVSKLKLCLFVLVALVTWIIVQLILSVLPENSDDEFVDEEIYEDQIFVPHNKLFNLNFEYKLNSNICQKNPNIFAIFIVTSYFGNVETRSSMRRSFSNDVLLNNFNVARIFLLGLAPSDKYTTQKSIEDESHRFGDLVQGNFHEAYRNLTYKHVMGYKWVSENCPHAKYVIKMDDDIAVDIRGFLNLLQTTVLPERNLLAGYILRNLPAIREPANKWYVTSHEYPDKLYPPFLSGWLYVTNPQTVKSLLRLSYDQKYLWIDDVFVTGILAKRARIRHYDLSKYFAVHAELLQCCITDLKKQIKCDLLIGPNGGENNLFYEFNTIVDNCRNRTDCRKRDKPLKETCVAEKQTHLGRGDAVINPYKLH